MVRRRAEFLSSNLAQLQNLIKRDSQSYHDEFITQYTHFVSSMAIFKLKPDNESTEFGEIIMFIAQISTCYPLECHEFPLHIIGLLEANYQIMVPDLRKTMCQALILMRNRNLIGQSTLLSLFFTLFRCKDKVLRVLLHNHIVNDIKNANAKAKNNKLNKTLQNYMYKMLQDPIEIAAKKSLEVMIELYQKNVWNDVKTVNVISEACLSGIPKLVAPSLHFFLGTNDDKYKEVEEDDDVPDLNSLKHANTVNKKRKSRLNQMDKAFATVKRKERQKNKAEIFNFSALHLLNDPQGFADSLFSKLKQATAKNTFNFELRLEIMNLISRLIGVHKLIILGFYDFLISYIKPHQKNVTQILAYVAQASHELVPPDALESVIRGIANNFVWSNCASEVITAGLNALRETCIRCPLAMPEELLKSLLDDYKNHRDKGPMTAARALLGLFREFNPDMLKKKDRGKSASINIKNIRVRKYGEVDTLADVADADLLELNSDNEDVTEFGESESGSGVIGDDEEVPELVSDAESQDNGGLDAEWEEESLEEIEDGDDEDGSEDENEGKLLPSGVDDTNNADEIKPEIKKAKLSMATQKIFTDEDFAKIRERKETREVNRLAGVKMKKVEIDPDDDRDIVDVAKIMAFTRRKDDYEARMESIKEGREGRSYGSKRGKDERSSTTNREKSKKNKPMTMLVHKRSVKGKKTRSLVEKQRVLRAHITKQKKKGH